jgi:hypothetical protein
VGVLPVSTRHSKMACTPERENQRSTVPVRMQTACTEQMGEASVSDVDALYSRCRRNIYQMNPKNEFQDPSCSVYLHHRSPGRRHVLRRSAR